jgi:hypothetical protein
MGLGLISCGTGRNTCTCILQEKYKTVYFVDEWNYIVIDSSNTVYHALPQFKWCDDKQFTLIKIK